MSSLLLINDMTGYGKVALSAMMPILSAMKFQVYNLPTALVSNTLDYGKFEILETTPYMKHCMDVWDELGFVFDTISTGFLASREQAGLVASYCEEKKKKGAFVCVDPIMGDNGKLYNGVTEQNVRSMREMCRIADLAVPNVTEAAFLTGKYMDKKNLTQEEAEDLIRTLQESGARSVVITSMTIDHQTATLLLDGENDRIQIFPYREIPMRFPGSGDIFSSVLIGHYRSGSTMEESVRKAMEAIERLITAKIEHPDGFRWLPMEILWSQADGR